MSSKTGNAVATKPVKGAKAKRTSKQTAPVLRHGKDIGKLDKLDTVTMPDGHKVILTSDHAAYVDKVAKESVQLAINQGRIVIKVNLDNPDAIKALYSLYCKGGRTGHGYHAVMADKLMGNGKAPRKRTSK